MANKGVRRGIPAKKAPAVVDLGLPVQAQRLIVFGHSFAQAYTPFVAKYPWHGWQSAAMYPELLVSMLGVDVNNRWIRIRQDPLATATTTSNRPTFIPEEGVLEGVYIMPVGTLTGNSTNTRAHYVSIARDGAGAVVANLRYLVNVNLAFGAAQTIYEYQSAANSTPAGQALRDSNNVLTTNHPSANPVGPAATGSGSFQTYINLASAAIAGTGVVDPGGDVIIRWGGNYRNFAVDGSKLVTSGLYHGGWAACWMGRPIRRVYGPEINATGGTSATVACQALEFPVPAGWKIAWSDGQTSTVGGTAANADATSVVVTASLTLAAGVQGIARAPFSGTAAGSYHELAPLGVTLLTWGRNDAVLQSTVEQTGWSEALRATAALACCPYFQPADRGNIVYANGTGGSWATYTAPAAGQWIVPWAQQGKGVKRYTPTSTTPSGTITINIPPAYTGAPIDLFFLAQAGTSKGGKATITATNSFNGGTACTINTSSACLNDNITTGLAGTVSGTTTLTLSSGTFDAGLIADIGKAIKGTAGTGTIAAGTKISAITSTTVCTLDTAGTNGTVTAVETAGYVPMVKRLVGLPAGSNTITVTLTAADVATAAAEIIFMGYGVESIPTTPVIIPSITKGPNDSAHYTKIDTLNLTTQQVIVGTFANPNAGNSVEPALAASVKYCLVDTVFGSDANYYEGDGVHLNDKGQMLHAKAIYDLIRATYTTEQMGAR